MGSGRDYCGSNFIAMRIGMAINTESDLTKSVIGGNQRGFPMKELGGLKAKVDLLDQQCP